MSAPFSVDFLNYQVNIGGFSKSAYYSPEHSGILPQIQWLVQNEFPARNRRKTGAALCYFLLFPVSGALARNKQSTIVSRETMGASRLRVESF
jgi:hypothetical protein